MDIKIVAMVRFSGDVCKYVFERSLRCQRFAIFRKKFSNFFRMEDSFSDLVYEMKGM